MGRDIAVSNTVDSNDLPQAFGPYTLLKRLAVGGMAEVYVAKTRGMGGFEKRVALKLIHPRFSEDAHFVQMLVEEAKLSVLLQHRNIAQTFDLGCIDNSYFIVMEYIEGADCYRLGRRVKTLKRDLDFDVCAFVMAEVCSGLDFAHRKRSPEGKPLNIVHRDISPQNVLLSFAGEVKLVDFGIAKFALKEEETQTGIIKGKYHYMSPEQAWGDPTDRRSDIFSAGIVLYELLTGEMLYQTGNIPLLLDMVRKAEIAPPNVRRATIPWELTDIVMRAVAKRPGDRYQSAHDMGEALRGFLDKHSPSFAPERLALLLGDLFHDEVQQSVVSRFPSGPPSAPPKVKVPSLPPVPAFGTEDTINLLLPIMQREEFSPQVGQSVIFRLEDLGRRPVTGRVPPSSAPPLPMARSLEPQNPTFRPPALAQRERKPSGPGSVLDTGERTPPMPMVGAPGLPKKDWDEPTFVDDGARLRALVDANLMAEGQAIPSRPPRSGAPSSARVFARPPGSVPAEPSGSPGEQPFDTGDAWEPPTTRYEPGRDGFPRRVAIRPHGKARGRRSPAWGTVALVVGLLAVAAGVWWFTHPSQAPVLEVVSLPEGAVVWLDGVEFTQRTPATIRDRVRSGETHRLELRLDGYERWTTQFTATDGRMQQVATLTPLVTALTVETKPRGAEVWIDGKRRGKAPLRVEDLPVDVEVTVRVTAPGFQDALRTLRTRAGEPDVRMRIELDKK